MILCNLSLEQEAFGGWELHIARVKNTLEVSPRTMLLILDEAKAKEKERIDKLIDMEVEKKNRKEQINSGY